MIGAISERMLEYFFASERTLRLNSVVNSICSGRSSVIVNICPKFTDGHGLAPHDFLPALPETFSGRFQCDAFTKNPHDIQQSREVFSRGRFYLPHQAVCVHHLKTVHPFSFSPLFAFAEKKATCYSQRVALAQKVCSLQAFDSEISCPRSLPYKGLTVQGAKPGIIEPAPGTGNHL
jgi:hypothetical protein